MNTNSNVLINDCLFPMPKDKILESCLVKFGAVKPYAILLNNQFIPASEHAQVTLKEHDRIEVISAIQGG